MDFFWSVDFSTGAGRNVHHDSLRDHNRENCDWNIFKLNGNHTGRLRTETGRSAGKKDHHHADHIYHVVRWWYDPYLYSVQKPAPVKLFLGVCGAKSGKRYLSVEYFAQGAMIGAVKG